MTLTFAKTHNMIAYLTKSDASEGFIQIINFLNGSSIKYALTINPNIYVSCIKQFWTSVAVKNVNDVTRLQALVNKKKVIVSEATIREALRLDDAEGIECLPNEEIFVELARMGNQVGDLSSHSTKYTSPALAQKVFANMRRVGKGFSGVDTSLFEGMLVVDVHREGALGRADLAPKRTRLICGIDRTQGSVWSVGLSAPLG
nr:xylulose kinase-1 [Tanacetum cinerariifolium]